MYDNSSGDTEMTNEDHDEDGRVISSEHSAASMPSDLGTHEEQVTSDEVHLHIIGQPHRHTDTTVLKSQNDHCDEHERPDVQESGEEQLHDIARDNISQRVGDDGDDDDADNENERDDEDSEEVNESSILAQHIDHSTTTHTIRSPSNNHYHHSSLHSTDRTVQMMMDHGAGVGDMSPVVNSAFITSDNTTQKQSREGDTPHRKKKKGKGFFRRIGFKKYYGAAATICFFGSLAYSVVVIILSIVFPSLQYCTVDRCRLGVNSRGYDISMFVFGITWASIMFSFAISLLVSPGILMHPHPRFVKYVALFSIVLQFWSTAMLLSPIITRRYGDQCCVKIMVFQVYQCMRHHCLFLISGEPTHSLTSFVALVALFVHDLPLHTGISQSLTHGSTQPNSPLLPSTTHCTFSSTAHSMMRPIHMVMP